MSEYETDVAESKWQSRLLMLAIFLAVAFLAGALGYVLWGSRERVDKNRDLIEQVQSLATEIQRSRIASCRQTYEGVREVFLPFFPPPPRTKEQQANLDKFNRTVDRLKTKCATQTQPKEDP